MHKRFFTLLLTLAILGICVAAPAQDPVAWYKFDGGPPATTAIDSSVNANTATFRNSAAWSTDVDTSRIYDFGSYCVAFDAVQSPTGPTSVITAPHISALDMGTGDLTVSFMMKSSATYTNRNQHLLVKGGRSANTTNGGHYVVYRRTGDANVVVEIANSANAKCEARVANPSTGAPEFFNGQWTHLVGVINRTEQKVKVYHNGTEIPSAQLALHTWNDVGNIDSPMALHIGCEEQYDTATADLSRAYNGLMDDVRIYNRALSAAEIQSMYPTPTPTPTNTPTPLPPAPASASHWEIFD